MVRRAQGVVFDLDGTLVSNMALHAEAFRLFVARHGLPPLDEELRGRLDGKRNSDIFPILFARALSAEEQRRFADEKEGLYRELSRGRLRPLPGLDRLLAALERHGIPVAVATSAPTENVPYTLAELGLEGRLTRVVRSDSVPRGKPYPDVFLAAAREIGIAPERCLAFEDAPAGILAARAAGMTCVAVTTSFSPAQFEAHGARPDVAVADFEAFLAGPGAWLEAVQNLRRRAVGAARYPGRMPVQDDALPRRPLGSSGLDITTVGFGAWAAGGGGWAFGWGPQDDEASLAAMRHALERGVNWIDTAAVYGLGHSEEVVGRLLRALPAAQRPLVFTKCGLAWDARQPMVQAKRVLRPEAIRAECEASLRRLGVERIDLYQFHWPDESGTPVEDSWAAMARLVEEGKVRAAGVSNFGVELLERAQAVRHVDSLQPPFSLIRRGAAGREIPWCARHRTGVIVYSPMQSGLLTEGFDAARVGRLAADDWRRRAAEFQPPNLDRNLALRDALRPIAVRHGVSVSAVAVAWALAWPGVTGAIVGARSPEQVDGWIGAASLKLDAADLDQIAAALARTGAGSGPMRPP